MTNGTSNIIPFPRKRPSPDHRPETQEQQEQSIAAIRTGIWTLHRAELAQAGIAMAEQVEEAREAEAETAFLDAAKAAFAVYERILVEAGRQPEPLRASGR